MQTFENQQYRLNCAATFRAIHVERWPVSLIQPERETIGEVPPEFDQNWKHREFVAWGRPS